MNVILQCPHCIQRDAYRFAVPHVYKEVKSNLVHSAEIVCTNEACQTPFFWYIKIIAKTFKQRKLTESILTSRSNY